MLIVLDYGLPSYKRVVELKHAYFRSAEYNNSLHSRSIMVGLPRRR